MCSRCLDITLALCLLSFSYYVTMESEAWLSMLCFSVKSGSFTGFSAFSWMRYLATVYELIVCFYWLSCMPFTLFSWVFFQDSSREL